MDVKDLRDYYYMTLLAVRHRRPTSGAVPDHSSRIWRLIAFWLFESAEFDSAFHIKSLCKRLTASFKSSHD